MRSCWVVSQPSGPEDPRLRPDNIHQPRESAYSLWCPDHPRPTMDAPAFSRLGGQGGACPVPDRPLPARLVTRHVLLYGGCTHMRAVHHSGTHLGMGRPGPRVGSRWYVHSRAPRPWPRRLCAREFWQKKAVSTVFGPFPVHSVLGHVDTLGDTEVVCTT